MNRDYRRVTPTSAHLDPDTISTALRGLCKLSNYGSGGILSRLNPIGKTDPLKFEFVAVSEGKNEPTIALELTAEDPEWSAALRRTIEYEFIYDRFPAFGDFVQDFFAGYETGDVPVTVDDALQLLRVLDAAYESADRERWVAV